MSALAKYLARYAEPESRVADALGTFEHVITVPACAESPALMAGLGPALHGSVLTIVVVNGPPGDAKTAAVNRDTLASLTRDADRIATEPPCFFRDDPPLLVVDRASPGDEVPAKRGVGLARKVAADVAAALFSAGKLESRFIHLTDGDVTLPHDYLHRDRLADGEGAVLLTYPFRHVPSGEPTLDDAHGIYEAFLRYYVLGLGAAGSPYALHTIGSTLAVDVEAYAAVRGVPRRQAAEDFYLVNKVTKLGRVHTPGTEPLRIHARHSSRVPFGTGRSTATIAAAGGRGFYHPAIFELLALWLAAVDEHAATGAGAARLAVSRARPHHRDALAAALRTLDAEASLDAALAAAPKDAASRRRRAHEHFDAFRTRKLVHLLRDGGLGELDWREALRAAPFLDVDARVEPFAICEALAAQEAARPLVRR